MLEKHWVETSFFYDLFKQRSCKIKIAGQTIIKCLSVVRAMVYVHLFFVLHTTNLILLDIWVSSAFGIHFYSNWNIKI